MTHKPIPLTFRKDGFDFTQLQRLGDWCLYSKTKTGFKSTFFEVMRILTHDGREIAGQKIEPAEYLPGNESWGNYGFSFSQREVATRFLEAKAGETKQSHGNRATCK
jgi:hypothetical protein